MLQLVSSMCLPWGCCSALVEAPCSSRPFQHVNFAHLCRMLDRIGDELARATSIVRYAPGSSFSRHTHGGGEEYFVLDGVFQDDEGDHPTGEYVRNPPTSSHTPYTDPGCTIFVKLWQMKPEDRNQVNIDMNAVVSEAETGRSTLFKDDEEHVYVQQLAPEEVLQVDAAGGAEVFVIAGKVRDEEGGEVLPEQSWMRVPAGGAVHVAAGHSGAKLWVKEGHLLKPRGLDLAAEST